MRLLPVVLLLAALAAVAAPVSAQPPTFTHAYQLRVAEGDIPTTTEVEPADSWNVDQRMVVDFDNSTAGSYGFTVPAGHTVRNATCTCDPSEATVTAGFVRFTLGESVPSGSYTLVVSTTAPQSEAMAVSIGLPLTAGPDDRVVVLFVPHGREVTAVIQPTDPVLPTTDGTADIVVFDGQQEPVPDFFWASIHPATAAGDDGQDGASGGAGFAPWLWLALGLLVGIILWAVLVSKGVVQKRSRKQVAGTAAHVEAAANETPAVLEGRKRALLAALKEIEVAKMNNEMAPEVYDTVKADLKKQAVTVMRALEAGTAEGEARA